MDEETRALQERRAFKLSQKTHQAPTHTDVLKNDATENVLKTKKRTRVLFEDPKKQDVPSPSPIVSSRVPEQAWFLSFAKDFEKEISDAQDCLIKKSQSDDFLEMYGPKTWDSIYEFSETVSFVNGPRNQFRSQKFSSLLHSLLDYVKNWNLQKLPLLLHGETGSGKTRCLQLLGNFLGFDCVCLHDIFIDQLSKEEFKERLLGFQSRGLSCNTKLWVIEHYDTLNEQQKNLLHGAFPSMMKTGALVCTSWPSSSQLSARFKHLEFLPWTTTSKKKFLSMDWSPPLLKSPAFFHRVLKESGDNIASAYAFTQLWTSKSAFTKFKEERDPQFDEETSYIPVNLRSLVEESFSGRWCPARSLALEAGESEITVQLLQEMVPMAIMQGRCKNEMHELSKTLDFFSVMDATVGYNAGAYKTVMEKRLIQNTVRQQATFSLEKFNSGSLLPIPQSFLSRSKGTSTQKLNRETISTCRGGPPDTRSWGEDIQLFLQASKKQWKSPFSIK
jgi:hypothetical protein